MKKIFSLATILLISLLSLVSADVGEGCGMYGMMSGSFGYGGMFFSWIFLVLVLVILVLLIVWLIKQIQKK